MNQPAIRSTVCACSISRASCPGRFAPRCWQISAPSDQDRDAGLRRRGRHFAPHVNGESTYFALLNRGKKSVTINLKSPEGVALIRDLARKSDVLVENFRPGVMQRLGLASANCSRSIRA